MKVKVKNIIVCNFGVTLYPNKAYEATEMDNGRYYLLRYNSTVSVAVKKKNIAK